MNTGYHGITIKIPFEPDLEFDIATLKVEATFCLMFSILYTVLVIILLFLIEFTKLLNEDQVLIADFDNFELRIEDYV